MTFQDSRVGSSLTDQQPTSGKGKVQIRRKRQSIMARTLWLRYLQKKRKSSDEPLAWRIMQLSIILHLLFQTVVPVPSIAGGAPWHHTEAHRASGWNGDPRRRSPGAGAAWTSRTVAGSAVCQAAGGWSASEPPVVDHQPPSQSGRSLIYSKRSDWKKAACFSVTRHLMCKNFVTANGDPYK